MRYSIGVDIGGTFTDFSVVDEDGGISLWKETSTPKDNVQAIEQGLMSLAEAKGASLEEFLAQTALFVHGSTIATNMVIQRNGPKTALVCTEGFRDILYFRDGYKPERYDVQLPKPTDFIPRDLRIPVRERIDYQGKVLVPFDETSATEAIATLKEQGVESIAVALLWSVVNPTHEQRFKAIVERDLPGVPVVLSSDVLPMIREWERTCSTVLSAYILPVISTYMVELERFLHEHGFEHPLLIMQLNGGSSPVANVLKRPIYALGSGPSAAPTAGLYCAAREGMKDILTVDMGGTSFDVCLVSNGEATVTNELRVEDTPVGVAAVDTHSIGAGGGSIGWIDKGGALQVGPQSAGAEPGPACYAQGGDQPTVTDANVILGYINPDYFLGGRRVIDPELSRRVVEEKVARPLGLTVPEAAHGIFRLVNSNMVDAMRVVSIERGIDPRGYALVIGGGAGAVHGGMLAAELGLEMVIIPRYAGVFCSYGMVVSDVKHDYMKTLACNTDAFDFDAVNAVYRELEAQALADLQGEGFSAEDVTLSRFGDAKYPAQVHELTIPLPSNGDIKQEHLADIAETFHALHERMFSYCVRDSSVDLYHWRVNAAGKIPTTRVQEYEQQKEDPAAALKGRREVYFGEYQDYSETEIYDGGKLLYGMVVEGPAVVEQENTTIVVFPQQNLAVNRFGDYVLNR
jgi:N-methylhydantoinase A